MSSVYVALPSLPKDDAETKPLVDSDSEEFGGYNTPSSKAPSKKALALAYFLCALTVLLASINLAATIKATRFWNDHHVSVDALPRPDIFTGLPKHPEILSPVMGHSNKDEHGENHTHAHSHSDLFFVAKVYVEARKLEYISSLSSNYAAS
ncbi:hypothetical protein BDZ97DRAFT_2060768 [Flammula alnicola]|nr:hypothetical protein BDZ97DRAFT_2060768 [Flammula alnicola]